MYDYPPEYQGPKSVEEQCAFWRAHFPNIGGCNVKLAEAAVPNGAEGVFIIPHPAFFQMHHGMRMEKILEILGKYFGVNNYRFDRLGERWLLDYDNAGRVSEMRARLLRAQPNQDLLVLPAQFGYRLRGHETDFIRELIALCANETGEFPLTSYEGLCMLCAHPERERRRDQLHMRFAGDAARIDLEKKFSLSTALSCYEFGRMVKVDFFTNPTHAVQHSFGVLTGFAFSL